jgi:hypothetical protein
VSERAAGSCPDERKEVYMKKRRKYKNEFERATDPLSTLIFSGLDALEKRISRFVISEMNQIVRFVKRMRRG